MREEGGTTQWPGRGVGAVVCTGRRGDIVGNLDDGGFDDDRLRDLAMAAEQRLLLVSLEREAASAFLHSLDLSDDPLICPS